MLNFTINNSNKVFIKLELHTDCVLAAQASSLSLNPRKFWKKLYSTRAPNGSCSNCWVSMGPSGLFFDCTSSPLCSLYFSHNSKTTTWLDPRLAKKAKPPEKCEEGGEANFLFAKTGAGGSYILASRCTDSHA